MALVIGVECGVAYMYLPSAAETAALAGSAVEKQRRCTKAALQQEAEKEKNGQVEVDLGEFNVTAYQPISNTTLRIDFHLYGTVAAAEQKEFMAPLGRKSASFSRTSHCNASAVPRSPI